MQMAQQRRFPPVSDTISFLYSGGSRISRWGAPTRWGGANLRRIPFLVKMYAKTKEMDLVWARVPAAPPGSANALQLIVLPFNIFWQQWNVQAKNILNTSVELAPFAFFTKINTSYSKCL